MPKRMRQSRTIGEHSPKSLDDRSGKDRQDEQDFARGSHSRADDCVSVPVGPPAGSVGLQDGRRCKDVASGRRFGGVAVRLEICRTRDRPHPSDSGLRKGNLCRSVSHWNTRRYVSATGLSPLPAPPSWRPTSPSKKGRGHWAVLPRQTAERSSYFVRATTARILRS